ncbi:MAG: ATP-binding cassette domain-containing protein [Micropruina sp.]|nr:ATP-binding cassette domain-containing protein [Micropruina sp.]
MLELRSVDVGYGRTTVLKDVSLTVPDQGIVAVLGHNGAGKSTLLRGAMGLLKPSRGSVLLDGEDITRLPTHARVRRGLAYVPQGQQSFGDLTTRENLQLVADGTPHGAERMSEAVDLFPALADLMERRAGLLSGGQRQQLAIARALIAKPRLLMLDEPTEGIQPTIVQLIERTVAALAADGLAIVLVEQHVGFALGACDSFVVLTSGRVSESGRSANVTPSQIREAMAI